MKNPTESDSTQEFMEKHFGESVLRQADRNPATILAALRYTVRNNPHKMTYIVDIFRNAIYICHVATYSCLISIEILTKNLTPEPRKQQSA